MVKLFPGVSACLFCIFFSFLGCKTDKKEKTINSPNQGAATSVHETVLSPTDLVPGKMAAVASEQEFLTNLQETVFIYANDPTTDQSEQCMKDLYGNIPVVSKLGDFEFSVTLDATACAQAMFSKQPQNKIKVERTSIVISELMRCESMDFSKFNGQKLSSALNSQFQVIPKNQNCARYESMSQFKVSNTFSVSVETDGKTQAYRATQHTVNYAGNADLTPCRGAVTGGVVKLETGCLGISRKYYSEQTVDGKAADLEGDIFLKLEAQGLSSLRDGASVWHSSGQMKVTFNTCDANLAYSSPTTAPSYTLTCPSGLKSSGTLTANLKLKLLGDVTERIPSFYWRPIW
jgi:hypothetical protein